MVIDQANSRGLVTSGFTTILASIAFPDIEGDRLQNIPAPPDDSDSDSDNANEGDEAGHNGNGRGEGHSHGTRVVVDTSNDDSDTHAGANVDSDMNRGMEANSDLASGKDAVAYSIFAPDHARDAEDDRSPEHYQNAFDNEHTHSDARLDSQGDGKPVGIILTGDNRGNHRNDGDGNDHRAGGDGNDDRTEGKGNDILISDEGSGISIGAEGKDAFTFANGGDVLTPEDKDDANSLARYVSVENDSGATQPVVPQQIDLIGISYGGSYSDEQIIQTLLQQHSLIVDG